MRTILLLSLLCLPLLARDEAPLTRIVKLFKSNDAAARDEGSRLARAEIRKLLAPLVAAMEDSDPEVRRRARMAILSLVPKAAQEELDRQQRQQRRQQGLQQQQLFFKLQQFQVKGLQLRLGPKLQPVQPRVVHFLFFGPQAQLLKEFGITSPVVQVQGPLGARGFPVGSVTKGSPADRMGICKGDLIQTVNGKPAKTQHEFFKVLGARPDWTKVKVSVWRAGKALHLPVK